MTLTQLNAPLLLPCGIRLKNRVVKAAMTENLSDEEQRATARHVALYSRWAKGNVGLLITGNFQVDRRYLERPGNICVDGPQDTEAMARLRAVAEAGSAEGTQIWPQLGHAGRQSTGKVNLRPVGPSAVPLDGIPSFYIGHPRALTLDEVQQIPSRFANAARVCQEAGFGGVQVHAAHGYLLSSFLNPRANRRDDGYGGTLQNRAGLLLDVVRAIRATVNDGFGVAVKLNTADFQKGGFTHTEAIQVACMLAQEAVDILELSGGNYESPTISTNKAAIASTDNEAWNTIRESTRRREAYYYTYTEDVRRALNALDCPASMALMLTGGFRTATVMEGALEEGVLDLIGVGRPLCGDTFCVRDLLCAASSQLPSYEDQLLPGPHNVFGKFVRMLLGSFHLGKSVLFMAVQNWFYVMIYRHADGRSGEAGDILSPGPFGAYLENEMAESKIASSLVHPECSGTHYSGPRAKKRRWSSRQGLVAAVSIFLIALIFARL